MNSCLLDCLDDMFTPDKSPTDSFKIGDYVLHFGFQLRWTRLEQDENHQEYVRQGLAVKDWNEDLVWIGPWRIQEALADGGTDMQKYKERFASLPPWTKTRWVMVVNKGGICTLLDSNTGQRRQQDCPEAMELLERIKKKLKSGNPPFCAS